MTDGEPWRGLPVGVILAGGRGRRLGGVDKVLCPVGGRPILAWIVERLRAQCHAVLINANGDPDRFAAFALPVIPDDPRDADAGPLAGVLAAMTSVAARWPDRDLLTVTGDAPFLPGDLAPRLGAARAVARVEIAVAWSGGRAHPLTAVWSPSARDKLADLLRRQGCRRVEAAQAHFATTSVTWPGPADPFLNINTPHDLLEAERRAAAGP